MLLVKGIYLFDVMYSIIIFYGLILLQLIFFTLSNNVMMLVSRKIGPKKKNQDNVYVYEEDRHKME
jgi:hypothetical protein